MKNYWQALEHEWRSELLSHASGETLEVNVEWGSNFKYYPNGTKVTAAGASAKLVQKAMDEAAANGLNASFIVSPVNELQFPDHSFDTIVSTFSLCAFENPGQMLRRFSRWCKPGGIILLLEYGLSKHGVVRWAQKKLADHHYKKTGNHIDHDVLSLISQSKLRMKRVEVKFAGIVYLVWASLVPA